MLSSSQSFKNLVDGGRQAVGTMIVQVRTPAIVQVFVNAGLDFLAIDMEHGAYNLETSAALIQAARLSGLIPLVRVGDLNYHDYSLALDMGALGLISPRIEHPDQVKLINQYIKYPPQGNRGFSRLAMHALFSNQDYPSYTCWANNEVVNIIQIESQSAVNNADAILFEPGIDGVIVGMDDLALSMGIPGDTGNPLIDEALARVSNACKQKGIPWGFHSLDARRMLSWMDQGMQLVLYSTEISMIDQSLRQGLEILRPR